MVKIMENPIKMDDLVGKTHYFRKHPTVWRDPFVDSKKIPKMVYQNFQTKMYWWIFLG